LSRDLLSTPVIKMEQKIVAIVPAAGLSRRFGRERNKQFEMLGGRPLIIWALEVFEKMPEVTEIIPVLKPSDIPHAKDLFTRYGITKVTDIVSGGPERQDSVFNGLKAVNNSDAVLLVHDGARPFPEPETIRLALNALPGFDGVVIGATPKDTIKTIAGEVIESTPARESLLAVQTPQVFRCRTLLDAYERAEQEKFAATDDSALVERYGGRIRFVRGGYTNIKITTAEDLLIAEALLGLKGEER